MPDLNLSALQVVERLSEQQGRLQGERHRLTCGASVWDFGIEARGGYLAGVRLAEACLSGLGSVSVTSLLVGGRIAPAVQVAIDDPVAACLLSQYAGWAISEESTKFFAMGSGPMRAAAGKEELFRKLDYSEAPEAIVGVLETRQKPGNAVAEMIAEACGVSVENLTLLVAPTSSLAGTIQVVARSVETCLHQLLELGFELSRIQHGWGIAPLPPLAGDDLKQIGRTNDAILYGSRVVLGVTGDDESLSQIGARVPANSSSAFGRTFLDLFAEANHDFYAMDPALFAPAVVTFENVTTGNSMTFGELRADVVLASFGRGE